MLKHKNDGQLQGSLDLKCYLPETFKIFKNLKCYLSETFKIFKN